MLTADKAPLFSTVRSSLTETSGRPGEAGAIRIRFHHLLHTTHRKNGEGNENYPRCLEDFKYVGSTLAFLPPTSLYPIQTHYLLPHEEPKYLLAFSFVFQDLEAQDSFKKSSQLCSQKIKSLIIGQQSKRRARKGAA
ncbi:Mitogen-Activated Protein Kinase Kinase Kinase 19 [Manis pentadactyla]|nr:Mitogen-Activated Protein Kinase Kinase Kinase 19 [Manis pentadactyla]